jgi:hypothetical protein
MEGLGGGGAGDLHHEDAHLLLLALVLPYDAE